MSAQSLIESALPIITRDRVIKDDIQICPHCQAEIHEKGIALVDGKWLHRACKGELKMKPPSAEEQAFLDRLAARV